MAVSFTHFVSTASPLTSTFPYHRTFHVTFTYHCTFHVTFPYHRTFHVTVDNTFPSPFPFGFSTYPGSSSYAHAISKGVALPFTGPAITKGDTPTHFSSHSFLCPCAITKGGA